MVYIGSKVGNGEEAYTLDTFDHGFLHLGPGSYVLRVKIGWKLSRNWKVRPRHSL